MGEAVRVVGHGLLYEGLRSRLDELATAAIDGRPVVVSATDTWLEVPPADHDGWWLPIRIEHHQIVLGPLTHPGVPGCLECCRARRARARSAAFTALWEQHGPDLLTWTPTYLPPLVVSALSALVRLELTRAADGPTRPTYVRLALETLTVTRHHFLPDPLCSQCGVLPVDVPDDATIVFASRPKDPEAYRTRTAAELHPVLLDTFVDADAGIVARIERGDEAGFAVARASMRLRTADERIVVESGWGRSNDYQTSDVVALLEALERWGGLQPGGKRTVVHASYAELADFALDPRSFGLPDVSGTGSFQRFDPDVRCRWVWAWSFAGQRPVLVPEGHAYYGIRLTRPDEPRFADEISNGCAIGSCMEEAVLHGLFEVAERDAFLTTWYTRFPRRAIRLTNPADRPGAELVNRIRANTGYKVLLFDTTLEYGIPSVWAMAVHPDDRPDDAKAVCSAAAHVDPRRAVLAAVSELGPVLSSVRRSFPQHRTRVRAMLADSAHVSRMTDHSLLYADVDAFVRFSFLLDEVPTIEPAEMASDHPPRMDLRDDVLDTIGRFLAHHLDVIVVDQTTDEHRAAGLTCVKVLVPGTVPMSFGHANRRTSGLPRLFDVPSKLGHRTAPTKPDELNPYPHPFA
ncbi:TOMM precursor leader peptide-binding protein [Solwaraspora sp. WMMA2101]|uniref:TOMM precursor leader peptide-binding protein n=1 Tax=Solwaraspora sp. WMMA2101 TaxID=3404124 RepID=UPI003B938AC1